MGDTNSKDAPVLDKQQLVRNVQRDASLREDEKLQLIHQIMSGSLQQAGAQASRAIGEASSSRSSATSTEVTYKSYRDEPNGVLGCKHYQRSCFLVPACCGRPYVCRLCHNEHENHEIDRYATQEVICMMCQARQPVGQRCSQCGVVFGKYYCSVCKFFDDSGEKPVYHCPYCNLCRIGKGLGIDFFHCHGCNCCLSISLQDKHKCLEGALEGNCPVCTEYLFTSVSPVAFLRCGHAIHESCLNEYTKSNVTCPVCQKTLVPLSSMAGYIAQLDMIVAGDEVPPQFETNLRAIWCADCERESLAVFHFQYHKCQHCSSYNTRVKGAVDPASLPADAAIPRRLTLAEAQRNLDAVLTSHQLTPAERDGSDESDTSDSE